MGENVDNNGWHLTQHEHRKVLFKIIANFMHIAAYVLIYRNWVRMNLYDCFMFTLTLADPFLICSSSWLCLLHPDPGNTNAGYSIYSWYLSNIKNKYTSDTHINVANGYLFSPNNNYYNYKLHIIHYLKHRIVSGKDSHLTSECKVRTHFLFLQAVNIYWI